MSEGIESILTICVGQGEKTKGSRRTTSDVLDTSKLGSNHYRVVPDADSKDGPYFCAADFGGDDRGNDNIKSIGLLCLDIDKSTQDEMRESLKHLKSENIEFLCYTTASHNPDSDRIGYRLLLRPARPLNLSEYRFTIDYVNRRYRLNAAPESRVPSQAMFYPTVIDGLQQYCKYVHYVGNDKGDQAGPIDLPSEVLDAAAEEHKVISGDTSMPVVMPPGIDEAYYLTTLLDVVNPTSLDYNQWLQVGFAMHHQTFGKHMGRELWNAWSSLDTERYEPDKMAAKWDSFKENPKSKGVTIRTVLNWEVSKGITNETRLVAKLLKQAETGHVLEALRTYVVELAEEGFLRGINSNIAEAYVQAKKRLFDIKITLGEAQHDLRSRDISDERRSFFHRNFVYVSATNEYYELMSGHLRNAKYMDAKYTREYGTPDAKGVCKPVTSVLDREKMYDQLRFANGFVYEPASPGQLVERTDGYYINEFKHSDWHDIPDTRKFGMVSGVDNQVETMVSIHMNVLSDNRPEVSKFLMQYIAHMRQRPGVRIHHAVCITSAAQGIGKSITHSLIEAVLGRSNVGSIDKKTMAQANFNSYVSARKMIQIIDEFDDLHDRRSAEILTSLKSAITSDHGPVSFKGKDAQEAPYYASYWMFSNNRNVLNGEGGRRWSQFDVRNVTVGDIGSRAGDTLEAVLGTDREVFFDKYMELIREYPDRFAAFFDSISLEGFEANKPLIMEREDTTNQGMSLQGVLRSTFEDMVASGHKFVKHDIIHVSCLQNAVRSNYIAESGGQDVSSPATLRKLVGSFLMDRGYEPVRGRKLIPGMGSESRYRPNSIYTRGNQTDIIAKYQEYVTPTDEDFEV